MPKTNRSEPLGALVAYLITNLENGKAYVGITNNLERRWAEHKAARKRSTSALRKAFLLYGPEKFKLDVIACARTYSDLQDTERLLIAQFGTHVSLCRGYNLTIGGEGMVGYVHTEADLEKMRGPKSPAHVEKMRGRKHSPETIEKLRGPKTESHKEKMRKPLSAARREQLRICRVGFKHSDTVKQKMSAQRKGKARPASALEGMRAGRAAMSEDRRKETYAAIAKAHNERKLTTAQPWARKVSTPQGVFDSLFLAALATGTPYEQARYRARTGRHGWSYLEGGL